MVLYVEPKSQIHKNRVEWWVLGTAGKGKWGGLLVKGYQLPVIRWISSEESKWSYKINKFLGNRIFFPLGNPVFLVICLHLFSQQNLYVKNIRLPDSFPRMPRAEEEASGSCRHIGLAGAGLPRWWRLWCNGSPSSPWKRFRGLTQCSPFSLRKWGRGGNHQKPSNLENPLNHQRLGQKKLTAAVIRFCLAYFGVCNPKKEPAVSVSCRFPAGFRCFARWTSPRGLYPPIWRVRV